MAVIESPDMTGHQFANGLVDEVAVGARKSRSTDAPKVINEVNAEASISALYLVCSAVVYFDLAENTFETCQRFKC